MSILIKGMEMPNSGEFKHIRIYDNGDVTVEVNDGEAVIAHAVPVPPHGRLIDADALCKTLRSLAENEYTPKVFANWIENHIDTIIPAEEGE